jgi:small conductance mechanosensitive channel
MRNPFPNKRDLYLERMFETRSEAWDAVGLSVEVSQRTVRRARREAIVFIPLLIGVLIAYYETAHWIDKHAHSWLTWSRIATALITLGLGWWVARAVGRAAAPTFFKRMDPSTAGTVGFLIRLVTIVVVVAVALDVLTVNTSAILAGSAFTAVVFGLAAQQTLGNLIAGTVLLSARPFRVGEKVRLQAGALGGAPEGIVSSLGLLYTTLARGDDRIMIPNSAVLNAVVVPRKEPDALDVRVRLSAGVRPTHVQSILDSQISIATRQQAVVLLEEIDGGEVIVRIQATPERGEDGAKLADEVIAALGSVTGEHPISVDAPRSGRGGTGEDGTPRGGDGGPVPGITSGQGGVPAE